MSEPRIPLLDFDEAAKAAASVDIPEQKIVSSFYRTLLHHPDMAKRVQDLVGTLLLGKEIDHKLRELIILRIGWSLKGVYEWTHHWRIAVEHDVEERDRLSVRDWQAHDHWSPEQSAVLSAADEMIADGNLSDSTWAECAKCFPKPSQQLELLLIIGSWKMISEIITSFRVPLEDIVEPWPPNGEAPA